MERARLGREVRVSLVRRLDGEAVRRVAEALGRWRSPARLAIDLAQVRSVEPEALRQLAALVRRHPATQVQLVGLGAQLAGALLQQVDAAGGSPGGTSPGVHARGNPGDGSSQAAEVAR